MGFFDKLKQKIGSVAEALSFDRLKDGLAKTRDSFVSRLKKVLFAGRKIDQSLLDEIEEILITSDVGVTTTSKIIGRLQDRVRTDNIQDASLIIDVLKEEIAAMLADSPSAQNDATFAVPSTPHVIMVIGVNGVGKTTTIGKLAHNYKKAGRSVLIGAADTFRAAANEQLEVWAERAGVEIVQQRQGADPAAVAYDTVNAALSRSSDVVIIDTAGRLHNKQGLMQELEKIGRVMKKLKSDAPNDVYLVLDATTGQNAIQQAREFTKVAPITGIILTKLDGTAKGGAVIAIADALGMPVRYIGVGERIDDLQVFDTDAFVEALFEDRGETPDGSSN
ncbi:MAG TPA: signal recognition particle-docking protein FtsY [Bacteroidetes bacterium]|nr:signal recognition particle-docking protein FtsY [Bacteroidota bacterium]HRK04323.1 signal recognition particle-docking protein FtsY [Chlorobiota bacterium]